MSKKLIPRKHQLGGPIVRGIVRNALKSVKKAPVKKVPIKNVEVLETVSKEAPIEPVEILGWEEPMRDKKGNIIGYIQHDASEPNIKPTNENLYEDYLPYKNDLYKEEDLYDSTYDDLYTMGAALGIGSALGAGIYGYNEYKKKKKK